ncbi:MAG: hypothetical protein WA485_09005 [Candidatus Sulfotelmatobacter sp.]
MALKTYKDADGNDVTVDDEVSLIGPAAQPQPQESTRNPQYQPIHYTHTGAPKPPTPAHDPHSLGPQPTPDGGVKHAGNSGLNDPDYLKRTGADTTKHAGNSGLNDPDFQKLWEKKNGKGGV